MTRNCANLVKCYRGMWFVAATVVGAECRSAKDFELIAAWARDDFGLVLKSIARARLLPVEVENRRRERAAAAVKRCVTHAALLVAVLLLLLRVVPLVRLLQLLLPPPIDGVSLTLTVLVVLAVLAVLAVLCARLSRLLSFACPTGMCVAMQRERARGCEGEGDQRWAKPQPSTSIPARCCKNVLIVEVYELLCVYALGRHLSRNDIPESDVVRGRDGSVGHGGVRSRAGFPAWQ